MSAPERIWLHPSAMTVYVIPPETNTLVQFVRADIAASQLAEARAELALAKPLYSRRQLEAERDRLAADNARLREALEPFVAISEAVFHVDEDGREMNERRPDDLGVWGFDRVTLTYGHLRRARAALASVKGD